tara:strand:+ start:225043 stop:225216 length:174 start_codon:yes stop_codon:yes gene_type:complete
MWMVRNLEADSANSVDVSFQFSARLFSGLSKTDGIEAAQMLIQTRWYIRSFQKNRII